MTGSALTSATQSFYWKPAHAWFRSLELHAYRVAGVTLDGPVLDLGCGDGTVAQTLTTRGVLEREDIIGLDYLEPATQRAREASIHSAVLRGDARHLPFSDCAFRSVVSNGVLCAIPEGVENALAEVARVLRPGGVFAATVPTDRFVDTLLLPRLLGRVSPGARARYLRRVNRRLDHLNPYASIDEWTQRWERAGLVVDRVEGFFSVRAGCIYNLLALHLLRVFGLLRKAPRGFGRTFASLLHLMLERAYEREIASAGRSGYVLILGHRPSTNQQIGNSGRE